jgi:energy-converting hydrogenase Eha subunit A
MKPTFNDKLIAYLVLLSGLAISGVAEYYSIMGLMAIYPAALIPIVIMGVVLGIGKISGTVWLKQNWEWSPFFLKAYVLPAIVVLMLITSLGVFGFLSKAHSDQSLVSGDVQSKIAVYDTKIQTARENIETNRKQLKQMDEAVDQVMGRSSDEKGADKANAIRKSQQRDRSALAKDIEANQKLIATLNDEAAPIRAEVRKVEAEVGPIKYIAHLLYGENPDSNILEKAVIWVTVLIVIVLDPLAVVLLLASQYSFQRFRELEENDDWLDDQEAELNSAFNDPDIAKFFERSREVARKLDAGETLEGIPGVKYEFVEEHNEPDYAESKEPVPEPETPVPVEQWNEWIAEAEKAVEEEKKQEPVEEPTMAEKYPYLNQPFVHFSDMKPLVHRVEDTPLIQTTEIDSVPDWGTTPILATGIDVVDRPGDYVKPTFDFTALPPDQEYVVINGENMHIRAAKSLYRQTPIADRDRPDFTEVIEPESTFNGYIQNEEQNEGTKWNRVISEAEYREQAQARLKNDSKDNTNNTP